MSKKIIYICLACLEPFGRLKELRKHEDKEIKDIMKDEKLVDIIAEKMMRKKL